MDRFLLVTDLKPAGDQPRAVDKMTRSIAAGNSYQTLIGVTGSGKTFTMARIIENINKPVLVLSHNKTLAAQLYSEFKDFFPDNAVEYFVSYYDYYQPEAYVPQTDVYIEKDASINDDIDRLRLSATSSLFSRKDVIVVASVSCIYGLGSPEDYSNMLVVADIGQKILREELLRKLVDIQYERNNFDLERGNFRVRGDIIEVFPAYKQTAVRVELIDDEVSRISEIDPVSGDILTDLKKMFIYPAKHFVTTEDKISAALKSISKELDIQLAEFRANGKLLEAQRLESRTKYDMEMLKELGYCNGIENYSRHISGRLPGSRPWCLLDYFGDDFLVIIDESHVTIPQLRAMYNGDQARKGTLVEYGFRLPSALDNRPLKYDEFMDNAKQILYVSATPGEYEVSASGAVAEQVIRPTGLIDPPVSVRPTEGQIYDIVAEIKKRADKGERVLVTTLTKRFAEELTRFLGEMKLRVRYMHSEIKVLDRVEIIRDLRLGRFDCLIGINLLREGLDLPEVSLVAVLDADKEGFLRSGTSLLQTAGRAARNVNGEVLLYADKITASMKMLIDITAKRREKQIEFNEQNGIEPKTIVNAMKEGIESYRRAREMLSGVIGEEQEEYEVGELITELERDMEESARNLQFERAIELRDQIEELRKGRSDDGIGS
ncbi:MAG: excinuclease ABC subunit UvrB [Candidatus Omnitrophica bacterium]|nr:excinuclease ABC subunit UvrB [Candidatus Omnitrophota bacterium]MBU1128929.1 excinuclease ABC subunit UvrB [Candidatus Omnitrophota bacterium]MBU1656973.1 excinuclease ABC subunit UvrB [Candidatus Omnitrophota bacterium]MBU1785000.1 excinuclease ABC subunit UvrB [Candidatus Omnitrophota bacterium]MBU1851916.1 excinuclease ABC subunit UvrB [Candidatus Omnitrophota bacterium]